MDCIENTVSLLQSNCCLAVAWCIPFLHAWPSAWTVQKTPFLCCLQGRYLVMAGCCDFKILALSEYATILWWSSIRLSSNNKPWSKCWKNEKVTCSRWRMTIRMIAEDLETDKEGDHQVCGWYCVKTACLLYQWGSSWYKNRSIRWNILPVLLIKLHAFWFILGESAAYVVCRKRYQKVHFRNASSAAEKCSIMYGHQSELLRRMIAINW
jgi:hypothetical protein